MERYFVEDLTKIIDNNAKQAVLDAERKYQEEINDVADEICKNCHQKPIILLAGPSGSGKTTTALRLAAALKERGHKTHTISMDNYFMNNEECSAAFGDQPVDWESPLCVNKALLLKTMRQLASFQLTKIPRFDFVEQKRDDEAIEMRCEPGDIVILEGIHCLNPDVTEGLKKYASSLLVYVGAEVIGRKEDDNMQQDKLRLMRRLMRDSLYRGRSAETTIEYFRKLVAGEGKYLFPYIKNADYRINTFLIYELSVYRNSLLEMLSTLPQDFLEERKIQECVNILQDLRFLPLEFAPSDSIVREFAGGSSLEY